MSTRWVKVMRTEPEVVREVQRLLGRSGIQSRLEDGSRLARSPFGARRDQAPVAIYVRGEDQKNAQKILRQYMAAGDANVSKHMSKLRGELAIVVCLGAVLFILTIGLNSGWGATWPAWICLILAAPFAWRRVRGPRA